jgi:hypothetical protein
MFECLGINIVKDTFSYTSHRTKGETIHRMYRNRDYFWDGSVHDMWILTPFTVDTLKPKCFQMAERKLDGGPSSSIRSLDMGTAMFFLYEVAYVLAEIINI